MKKVVVGLSGGVDSAVTAYLLQQEGYEVIGVSMKLWDCGTSFDSSTDSLNQNIPKEFQKEDATLKAKSVADRLGIRFMLFDFQQEFRERVVNDFVSEYRLGRTPNPCIVCNRFLKFDAMMKSAMELGAHFLATGHYARIKKLPNGRFAIAKAKSQAKDQTYALYRVTQEALSHTLFPLGDYEKDQIREIANKIGLPVANQKDSQEICFIPDHDYANFIKSYTGIQSKPGNFVDMDGTVIGKHRGILHYTIGQRKGLGAFGRPMFVKTIRPATNEVVLSGDEEVFATSLFCEELQYMGADRFLEGEEVFAKIRYSHKGAKARLYPMLDGRVFVKFDEPQRAITPGQAVVFYRDDYILGGGRIQNEL